MVERAHLAFFIQDIVPGGGTGSQSIRAPLSGRVKRIVITYPRTGNYAVSTVFSVGNKVISPTPAEGANPSLTLDNTTESIELDEPIKRLQLIRLDVCNRHATQVYSIAAVCHLESDG